MNNNRIKKSRFGRKSFTSVLALSYLFLFLMSGCSESDCSLGGRPAARFNFIDSKKHTLVSLFDSLTVTTLGTDSILLNKVKAINHITLPLNYVEKETTFILKYNRFVYDTLWVEHENYPHFISMDCGISMFYHLKNVKYTTNLIDSIALRNPDIDDNEKENFQIFYTTTSN